MKKYKSFYRRELPHWQPKYAVFFVTFQLYNCSPKHILQILTKAYEQNLRAAKAGLISEQEMAFREAIYLKKYEKWLNMTSGIHYLADPAIAQIVEDCMHRFDGEFYELITYCVMSNHVHMVFDTSIQDEEGKEFHPLATIMKRIKGPSGKYANQALGRHGKFWRKESYDHVVRNEESLQRIIRYILNNPVKAGLVRHWEEWPHSYISPSVSYNF